MPTKKVKPKEKALSYDSIIKEFIERLSDTQLIKFINAAYGKDLPLNSKVYKLWTESNFGRRRLSDLYIRIFDNTFHIEIQTLSKKSDKLCYPVKNNIRVESESLGKIAC